MLIRETFEDTQSQELTVYKISILNKHIQTRTLPNNFITGPSRENIFKITSI